MPREWPETNHVEFSARVDKADYEEFVGRFPAHGAVTWFIRKSLRSFLEVCREHPEQEELVKEAMQQLTSQPFGS